MRFKVFYLGTNINWECISSTFKAINQKNKFNSLFFTPISTRKSYRILHRKNAFTFNIGFYLHWKNSTHTHTHKVLKLYLTLTRKINATYWRSFFNNHFLRAVTSMATNILAFLSSSKSSQASKKISSSMLGMVWSVATIQYIEL